MIGGGLLILSRECIWGICIVQVLAAHFIFRVNQVLEFQGGAQIHKYKISSNSLKLNTHWQK